jgi:hypothetical protein
VVRCGRPPAGLRFAPVLSARRRSTPTLCRIEEQRLIADILQAKVPPTLFHYTSQPGFLGIIEKKEIWATSAHFLNDAKEFKYAIELLTQRIAEKHTSSTKLEGLLKRLDLVTEINVCVCSFSTKGDLLSQWRGYGQGGAGYSLGFSTSRLRTLVSQQDFLLCPVVYREEDQMKLVDEVIEKWLQDDHDFSAILPKLDSNSRFEDYFSMIAPIMKHPSFEEEGEWRIISPPLDCDMDRFAFRPGRYSLVPYYRFSLESARVDFPIKRVCVGPSPEQHLSTVAAELFLISHEMGRIQVQRSKIPYRSW